MVDGKSSKKRKAITGDGEAEKINQNKKPKMNSKLKRRGPEDDAPANTKTSKALRSILKTTTNGDAAPSKLRQKPSRKSPREDSEGNLQVDIGVKQAKKSKESKYTKSGAENEVQQKFSEGEEPRTEAFLKGFESDGDEEAAKIEGGLVSGDDVPSVPTPSKKEQKRLKRLAQVEEAEKPGVIYIGRIPHGFYEQEMRAYFEQFGKILRLRLSRNRKTGASKHHAWVEFESSTVADIVAKTMDNYLLFNHILKVRVVPDEQVPEALFKGANRQFKKVPWNKIEGRKLKQPATEEVWDRRVAKELLRRDLKAEKLKQLGYDFEAPLLKSAAGLARKAEPHLLLTIEDTKETIQAERLDVTIVKEKGLESMTVSKEPIGHEVSIKSTMDDLKSENQRAKKIPKRKTRESGEVEPLKKHIKIVAAAPELVGTDGKLSRKAKTQEVETIS